MDSCITGLYDRIVERKERMSLIGLGYVGLPIAASFSRKVDVIGFDVNEDKINLYKDGIDPTNEIGTEGLRSCSVDFTSNPAALRDARFHIVAVPTPVNADKTPNLQPLESASRMLGQNLAKGSVIVYESTVYPGVTEDVCVPILEEESGLRCGTDFKVGYSPERINPGDGKHRLEGIVKVVSGMDAETLDVVAKVYELIVEAGVHRAEGIRVAEAAKVIENSQRDINIAFMNELSIIFNRLDIDTRAVLRAARTKWNFLDFYPGLVGGHCIGVDPYYLTYKAEQSGYHSQIILSGRRINDGMGKYVAENVIKALIKANAHINTAKVAILGFSFKENCPDCRNTKVIDIINELREYGIDPLVNDPVVDASEAYNEYKVAFCDLDQVRGVDAVVVAVAHDEYRRLGTGSIDMFYNEAKGQRKVVVDIKGVFEGGDFGPDYVYWSL